MATAAPHVITKPFHHTQKIVANLSQGIEHTNDVIINYEVEREILRSVECIIVITEEFGVNGLKVN